MTTRPPAGSTRLPPAPPWLIYVGFVTLVVGIIGQALTYSFNYGQLSAKVERNTERVVALEVKDSARAEIDRRRDERGARIEAKLDLIMPSTKRTGEEP